MLHLTPAERDRLLLFTASELARRRLAGGVLLNVPEATAVVADTACEVARRGGRHADAVEAGRRVLRADQVLPEVPHVVRSVAVEAVFADGSRLVVVPDPFGPVPERDDMPGSVTPAAEQAPAPQQDRDIVEVEVVNTAPVPVSVTSHYHFFEANARLRFDRAAAYGRHLDVPAGTHVRFEPGVATTVTLAPVRGARVVIGFSGLVDGPLDEPGMRAEALERARTWGFLDTAAGQPDADAGSAVDHAMAHARATEQPA